jgi:hypothetical protein
VFVPLLQKQFPEIADFYLPPEGCSYRMAVVSIKKQYAGHAKRVMFGIWSFLRQFMYTKFIIVVDDDIDVRDWKEVMWAITTRMDPVRDTLLVENTPIDYLDFASPVSGIGGKMGMDATNKWPGETQREWGTPIVMDAAVKAKVDAVWDELGLYTRDDKKAGHARLFYVMLESETEDARDIQFVTVAHHASPGPGAKALVHVILSTATQGELRFFGGNACPCRRVRHFMGDVFHSAFGEECEFRNFLHLPWQQCDQIGADHGGVGFDRCPAERNVRMKYLCVVCFNREHLVDLVATQNANILIAHHNACIDRGIFSQGRGCKCGAQKRDSKKFLQLFISSWIDVEKPCDLQHAPILTSLLLSRKARRSTRYFCFLRRKIEAASERSLACKPFDQRVLRVSPGLCIVMVDEEHHDPFLAVL